MLYATDASIYQVEPLGVVIPFDAADAKRAVEVCRDHGVALLPRGGGTALAGQSVNVAVVLDLSAHCRRIRSIDASARRAVVEPGVVLDQLNAAAAPHGLMFGPDVATSSHATLGGMIGNNSAGAWSLRYGRTVEHLRRVDVLLADGAELRLEEGASQRDPRVRAISERVAEEVRGLAPEIRRRYPRIRRHVDGYNLDILLDQIERSTPGTLDRVNLAHLICGSEGTLATIVEAEVDLVPRPAARGLAVVAYPSVDAALESLRPILETGPAAVELVDDVVIAMALANSEYRRYVEIMPRTSDGALGAVLYVEYFADDAAGIESGFAALRALLPAAAIAFHRDAAAMLAAWKLRKAGEPLLHGVPGVRKPITFVEDTAVDPLRLPEFVREFRSIVAGAGTTAAYYAHASVGCLHIRPLICLRDEEDLRRMESIAGEIADLVVRYGGALSGEHGDGRVRSPFLERYFGAALCAGFGRIKAILDPQGRMNPGNIVSPGPVTAHLRVRPESAFVRVPESPTFFRYEREHGFGHAVEMCNGAGICRRLLPGGTMCPSYRVLLDERHATRGRGNALRLAITGQLDPAASSRSEGGEADAARAPGSTARRWDDPGTLETLRLCLSCKACKTECPSNVDISKLKAEYLGQRHETARPSLQTVVFGNVRLLNRLGSIAAGLANRIGRTAIARRLAERLLDLAPGRTIPSFAPSLRVWFAERERARLRGASDLPEIPADAPTVILFPDCFTLYNEPEVGAAAIRVLEAMGHRVLLPGEGGGALLSGRGFVAAAAVGCCGRSQISVGLMRQAARTVAATASGLDATARRFGAIAVVGCEPSCVSAIKDDWLELELAAGGPAVAALRALAARTWLVEEYIDLAWERREAADAARADRRPPALGETGAGSRPVLLHAHCHQKALWGSESSARLLRRIAGDRLRVIDSGCCGMAGSFGYTADRYHLSMAVGEQSLFPPLRAAPADAVICAPGTSCRHQIHDGTGRRAVHPVLLVAEAIGAA
ncbi:MAG TPA: FAD-linked oxidase C-terminal domain-containing protein [Phycisphaerales bacterium]|nr:FAD-linked oxidase C-terminal domain-containing protein [Phycisphaerales bacterium]HMP35882.1 FAD-linked oxidase C-terminal domain-containing protein [Phycisphaerales bacterium]